MVGRPEGGDDVPKLGSPLTTSKRTGTSSTRSLFSPSQVDLCQETDNHSQPRGFESTIVNVQPNPESQTPNWKVTQLDVMAHAHNPSIEEPKEEGSRVWSQHGQHSRILSPKKLYQPDDSPKDRDKRVHAGRGPPK